MNPKIKMTIRYDEYGPIYKENLKNKNIFKN